MQIANLYSLPTEKVPMMKIHDKIKKLREISDMTQNDMAEKLGMSLSGYTKIERGISKPNLPMLERIAKVLDISVSELLTFTDKNLISIICDNVGGDNSNNLYYGDNQTELEKAHLIIQHKNELLEQQAKMLADKEREIEMLREMINLLKQKK